MIVPNTGSPYVVPAPVTTPGMGNNGEVVRAVR